MTGRWSDAVFQDTLLTIGYGGLQVPPLQDVRAAAARVVAADPTGPAAVAVHQGRVAVRRRLDPDALAERLVVPAAADAEPDPRRALELRCADFAAPPDDLPFRLELGADRASVVVQHVVGDAAIANALLGGLLTAARGGELPAVLVTPTSPGVTRALLGQAVRRTRGLPRRHPAPPLPAGDLPWRRQPAVAHAAYTGEALRGLKHAAHRLGVRRPALLMAAVERSLAATGLAPDDNLRTVIVNCRQYLPTGMSVRGNLTAGQLLASTWTDPSDVDRAVTAAVDAGRPLLALLVTGALSRLSRGGGGAGGTTSGPVTSVRPEYSIVAAQHGLAGQPWAGAPTIVVGDRVTRPDQFVLIAVEVGASLQVSVSYDAGVLAADRVRAVLDGLGPLLAAGVGAGAWTAA